MAPKSKGVIERVEEMLGMGAEAKIRPAKKRKSVTKKAVRKAVKKTKAKKSTKEAKRAKKSKR
jgi:hypothetical protein